MYHMWEGWAREDARMVNHDEFVRVEGQAEKTFIVYTNVPVEQHMKELAPADGRRHQRVCRCRALVHPLVIFLDKPLTL